MKPEEWFKIADLFRRLPRRTEQGFPGSILLFYIYIFSSGALGFVQWWDTSNGVFMQGGIVE